MEKYFDLLLTSPLFAEISREELGSLLHCLSAREVSFAKGAPIFLEGDPAGFIGFVLEGTVEIVHDDFYGNRTLMSIAEQGQLFGESFACAKSETMPISGYALQESRVMWLECRRMLTVCSNVCAFHNTLIKNLLQVVACKNLVLSSKIRVMSRKTTQEKLMAYLMEQAKQRGSAEFTIPLSRQALADYLGVERSAMSAELSKLRAAGVLESKGSRFRLMQDA